MLTLLQGNIVFLLKHCIKKIVINLLKKDKNMIIRSGHIYSGVRWEAGRGVRWTKEFLNNKNKL